MRPIAGFLVALMSITSNVVRAAEPVGSDPLLSAPPKSLSADEIASLQARLADFAQLDHFRADNERLARARSTAPRIVFFGDSITQDWISDSRHPPAAQREYVNRGISGQTTAQMLLRFRQDVVNLQPALVLILAGTNDIAGNTGPMSLETIENNLQSMVELARANKIRVVLASLLPASDYPWRHGLQPAAKIRRLNAWIEQYARSAGATHVDFHSKLVNAEGGMDAVYAADGVHPTAAGYAVMTKLAGDAIEQALAK